MNKCQDCGYSGKARVEYLELLRPLERRIQNQRAELARLQPIAQWYSRYWGDPTAAPADLSGFAEERRKLDEMRKFDDQSSAAKS